MARSMLSGIDESVLRACEILLEHPYSPESPFQGYGDYELIFRRLSKSTPLLPVPITGEYVHCWGDRFYRAHPYKPSTTVSREHFDDSMMCCQCHEKSFGGTDEVEHTTILTATDFYDKMMIEPAGDVKRFERQLLTLYDWHVIEYCGNHRGLTAENDTHFYGFAMATS